MRWTKTIPKDHETRLVTKFLWFPKKIGQETRWLEKVTYKQAYWGAAWGWHDLWWINK